MVGPSSHAQYESTITTRSSQRTASLQHHASSSATDSGNDEPSGSSSRNDVEAVLEKKRKNASAQAAFRARRSTYIANLEETVISLEAVIRKLQDACRDAHDDASEFRDENTRLKALVSSFEERERIWKAYAKATAGTPAALAATSRLSAAVKASLQGQPQLSAPSLQQAGGATTAGPSTPPSSSSSVSPLQQGTCYSEDSTVYGDDGSGYGATGVVSSYGKVEDCDMDGMRLQDPMAHSSSSHNFASTFTFGCSSSSGNGNYHSSGINGSVPHTPSSSTMHNEFGDITSMALVQDHGYVGPQNDGSYYMTVSPTTSMSYPLPHASYPDSPATAYGNKVTFAADSAQAMDSGELALFSGDQLSAPLQDISSSSSHIEPGSPPPSSSARSRRHTYSAFPSAPSSASSPVMSRRNTTSGKAGRSGADRPADPTALSNTLAVIKAQAFGNVRKTRARSKRSQASAHAAKTAVEMLEARGLTLGLDVAGGVKRRRRGEGLDGGIAEF